MSSSKRKESSSSSKESINRLKYEIANEFGINLGPDTTARANGSVGGEITKRLVNLGQNRLNKSSYNNQK